MMDRTATEKLFNALKARDVAAARRAIAAGEDVNARDCYGCTPLRYADSEELCRMLMDAGAVPTTDDVVCAHYVDKLRLFVDRGVDVRRHRRMGETALWWALEAGCGAFSAGAGAFRA